MGLIREGLVQERMVIVGGECSRRVRGGFPGGGSERTLNMSFMFVTREVSQLETSALKLLKGMSELWFVQYGEKSELMSVMAETSQSAIGPYVAMASAASSLKAWAAVLRSSLLVNL